MPCLYTRSQSTALCQIHRHLNNQQPTTTFPPTVSHLLQIHFEKFSPVIAICGEFAGFIPGLPFRVYGNIVTDFSARRLETPLEFFVRQVLEPRFCRLAIAEPGSEFIFIRMSSFFPWCPFGRPGPTAFRLPTRRS